MESKQVINDPFVSAEERLAALENLIKMHSFAAKKVHSKVDLHLHTNYSDGYWTPSALIFEAYICGMEMIALTDHDGFSGIEEAFNSVKLIKKCTGVNIKFIPGIEFSTNFFYENNKKKEVHILGYFPSDSYNEFLEYLNRIDYRTKAYIDAFQKNRILRIYEMIRKFNQDLPTQRPELAQLNAIQSPIILDHVAHWGMRNSVSPGRLLSSTGLYGVLALYRKEMLDKFEHEYSPLFFEKLDTICEEMKSPVDFMKEYFDKKEPSAKIGYIGLAETPEWAVKTIKNMGGKAVLAHPAKYPELTHDLLELLLPHGLDGVEVVSDHFKDRELMVKMLEDITKQHPHLTITIGSDCHGHSIDGDIDYTPNNVMGLKNNYSQNIEKIIHDIQQMLNKVEDYTNA
jgi:predicted metal-dependent phosphoesterase TrpH